MQIRNLVAGVLTAALCTGCVQQRLLTARIDSEPKYAHLYHLDGRYVGTCPVYLNYPLTKQNKKENRIEIQGMEARWPSGASARCDTMTAENLRKCKYFASFNIPRPSDASNAELDFGYAIQKERTEIMKRGVATQERNAKVNEDQNSWNNYWNTLHLIEGIGTNLKNSEE